MYSPVSDEFLGALRGSGKRVITADLYFGGSLVQARLPVVSGHVSSDSAADIRRSASVQLVNPNAVTAFGTSSGLPNPVPPADIISVYGYEMVLKYGVEFSSGTQELVPLGTFVIWSAEKSFSEGDVFNLEMYDRSKYLQASQIPKLYDASGLTVQTAIQNLVTAIMPSTTVVVFGVGLTNPILPGGTTYDSTYLDAVLDLADSIGAQFYFDLEGVARCEVKPFLTATTNPNVSVFTADCGEGGVNITMGKLTSRDNIWNGVGCAGSTPNAATAQAYAEAFDMNPASPTYYLGPFGKQFKRIDRPELTTNAACYSAAQAELVSILGSANGVEFDMLPQPHLAPGDIITLIYPNGVEELHLIAAINFDLESGGYSVDTKGRTTS